MKNRTKPIIVAAVAALTGTLGLLIDATSKGSPPYPEVEKYLQGVPASKGWKLERQQQYAPEKTGTGNSFESVVEALRRPDSRLKRGHYQFDANGTGILVVAYHSETVAKRIDIISYLGTPTPPMESLRDDLTRRFPGLPCRIVNSRSRSR